MYWRYLNLADRRKIAKLPNQNHRQINHAYGILQRSEQFGFSQGIPLLIILLVKLLGTDHTIYWRGNAT